MSLTAINRAVNSIIADAKTKFLDDIKEFILSNLDEESAESMKELFDKFQEKLPEPVKEKKERTKRAPSEYNKFVGEKMRELKAADSTLSGKEAMQQAMKMWKEHKASSS